MREGSDISGIHSYWGLELGKRPAFFLHFISTWLHCSHPV